MVYYIIIIIIIINWLFFIFVRCIFLHFSDFVLVILPTLIDNPTTWLYFINALLKIFQFL